MEVKRTIKKMVALGMGAAMLGTTLTGALAADLADYPQPFVTPSGEFDAMIVVGEAAETGDVLGSIDIASNLQFQAGVNVEVGDSSEATFVAQDAIEIKDLNWGDTLNGEENKMDDTEFPDLMAELVLEDDDGDEYEYKQSVEIDTGDDITVNFGRPDGDIYEEPIVYLDMAGDELFNFVVETTGSDVIDARALDDNEEITMFGQELTFDNIDDNADEDIVLFGSDKNIVVAQGETVTVTVDGQDFDVSVLGGNSDQDSAIVKVGSSTKTLEKGDSKNMGGLDVYVNDVFISNIGTSQVSVSLFIGSNEYVLPDADPAPGNDADLEIDSDKVDGVVVTVTGADNTAVEMIEWAVTPDEMENSELGEEYEWLALGDSFVEPVFGFGLDFAGMNYELEDDAKTHVAFDVNGDELSVAFTNNDGEEYEVDIYTINGAGDAIVWADDFTPLTDTLEEDNIFILEESAGTNDVVTKIYEVLDIDDDENEVELKDLSSGDSFMVALNGEIGDTEVTIDTINADDFIMSDDSVSDIYTEDELLIEFEDVTLGVAEPDITFTEDAFDENADDVVVAPSTVTASIDSDDIKLDSLTIGDGSDAVNDENDDYTYALTNYGTYMVLEADDGISLDIYYPPEEVVYKVFVTAPDAVISKSTSTGGTTVKQPVAIQAGSSVLDTEISGYTNKNLIVVGGPAANRAAAAVLGLDFPTYGADSTIPENAAVLKLIDHGNGKTALLVAGWEADDTRRAARVLAENEQYALSGSEVRITGTSFSDITVETVQ